MKCNRILPIIVFVSIAQLFYGQERSVIRGEYPDHPLDNELFSSRDSLSTVQVNLFTYGRIGIEASEINFRNLFRNFPIYVDNAKDIELMYYHYVGVIENRKQIKRYVKRNFPPYVPAWGTSGNSGWKSDTGKFSTWRFTIEQDPFRIEDKDFIHKVEQKIQLGDEVWEVVFKLWDTTYHYYVFVVSKTYEVVRYGNMFGRTIPQNHIDYVNSKNFSNGDIR